MERNILIRKTAVYVIGILCLILLIFVFKNFNEKNDNITNENINITLDTIELDVGVTKTIYFEIKTDDTDSKLSWKSSDENIVIVDDNGKITTLMSGLAIITVSLESGISDSVTVIVKEKETDEPSNVLDDSKNQIAVNSAYNILSAIENYYINNLFSTNPITLPMTVDFSNRGNLNEIQGNKISITGTKPSSGKVTLNENGDFIVEELVISGFYCDYAQNKFTCEK